MVSSMSHTTARAHGDDSACPGSSSLAEDEHLRLQSEASTPYDPTNGAHLSLLRALWVGAGLGPGDEFEPVSTRWLSIGFQGADPSALHPPTPPTYLQPPSSSLQPPASPASPASTSTLHPPKVPTPPPTCAAPACSAYASSSTSTAPRTSYATTQGSNPRLAREQAPDS